MVQDQISPTFNMLYVHSIFDERAYFPEPKDINTM